MHQTDIHTYIHTYIHTQLIPHLNGSMEHMIPCPKLNSMHPIRIFLNYVHSIESDRSLCVSMQCTLSIKTVYALCKVCWPQPTTKVSTPAHAVHYTALLWYCGTLCRDSFQVGQIPLASCGSGTACLPHPSQYPRRSDSVNMSKT